MEPQGGNIHQEGTELRREEVTVEEFRDRYGEPTTRAISFSLISTENFERTWTKFSAACYIIPEQSDVIQVNGTQQMEWTIKLTMFEEVEANVSSALLLVRGFS